MTHRPPVPHGPLLRFLPALVAVAVMVLPAMSSIPVEADLEAVSVEALGTSATQGPLVLFLHEVLRPEDRSGHSDFTLQADRLRVETDHSDMAIGPPWEVHVPETTSDEYRDATVQGLENRGQYAFIVAPSAGGADVDVAERTCAGLASSQETTVKRDQHVDVSRADVEAETRDALVWRGCDASTLTLQGDFMLWLWNWDARLTTSGGDDVFLPSGHRPAADDPTGMAPMVGSADEQFLYATNATLTIPALTGSYRLYLDAAETAAQGGYQFHNATGSLVLDGDVLHLDRRDVLLQGDDLTFIATGRPPPATLAFRLLGSTSAVGLDGQWVYAPDPAPWQPLLPFAAGVLVVAFAAMAWRLQRRPDRWYAMNRHVGGDQGSLGPRLRSERRGVGYWLMAKDANRRGRHRRSLHHARRASQLFPLFSDALLVRAVAESHLGRHEAAFGHYLEAMRGLQDPRKQATACVGCSHACLKMGLEESATEWAWQAMDAHYEHARALLRESTSLQGLGLDDRASARSSGGHDPAVG